MLSINEAADQEVALTRSGTGRIDAIDMLRGLMIVLMVLDHVRDYFHIDALVFDPTDPARTTPLLFATRWVTHLCAPTFVFLSGVSIGLQRANGKPLAVLSAFLVKRGAWLILLEATVISFGFNFAWPFLFMQVIWAIGIGMIAMSLLTRVPPYAVVGLGVAAIVLTPALAALTAPASDGWAAVRTLFVAPGLLGSYGFVAYPAVPWVGILCLGYGATAVFLDQDARGRRVAALAVGLVLFAVLLRLLNLGDPRPWQPQDTAARTAMAVLNVSKYPPSTVFVAATLGVSLLVFVPLERLRGPVARLLLAFGRTPFFTYLCHIYVVHGLMLLAAIASGRPAAIATDFLLGGAQLRGDWGYSLAVVYALWLFVVLLLYPAARWFAGLKRRRRDWWLSYL